MRDIHPNYRNVVFKDTASGTMFLTRSTVQTNQTVQYEDGNEYPLYTLDLSSASHPFYTGKQMFVDSEGRVERFQRKYANKK